MQMIRSHIEKRDTVRKNVDTIDLDEKIRQIQEKNKEREKRFKEIQDDKLNASSDGICVTRGSTHVVQEKHCENDKWKKSASMPGVHNTNGRKLRKGRGQRLLEMSKEPLKAKDFELKAVKRLSEIVLKNDHEIKVSSDLPMKDNYNEQHQRYFDRIEKTLFSSDTPSYSQYSEKPKKSDSMTEKSQIYGGFNDWGKDNKPKDTNQRNGPRGATGHGKDKLDKETPHSQQKTSMYSEDWDTEMMDIPVDKSKIGEQSIGGGPEVAYPLQKQIHIESCSDQLESKVMEQAETTDVINHNIDHDTSYDKRLDKNIETGEKLPDHLPDNVKDYNENTEGKNNEVKEGDSGEGAVHVSESEVKEKAELLVEKDKKDRPKITVNIAKTASTTSFDEVMSMLSPLDVPSNWGDCNFDDNEDLGAITF